jgi:hypothetical protein
MPQKELVINEPHIRFYAVTQLQGGLQVVRMILLILDAAADIPQCAMNIIAL